MRSLPLKLGPGSDLRINLEQLARKENSSGFVLGVVGNLSRASFQCPGLPSPRILEGNLEIITLNGTLSPEGVHLHLSLSDSDCQVWGGHLEPGTLVLKGADLLVGFFGEAPIEANAQRTTKRSGNSRVEIAVMPGCPWCARALRILRGANISFNVMTIDNDQAYKTIKDRSGLTTFPQVFIDGKLIGGFDQLSRLHSSGKLDVYR